MKIAGIILFVLGLIVAISGYCLSNADDIPGVFRLFAADYVEASSALSAVKSKRTLQPTDVGFDVLSQLFRDDIARRADKPELLAQLSIEKIERYKTVALKVGGFQAASDEAVRYTLSNGQTLKWQLSAVQSRIDTLKHKALFRISLWIFIVGIGIQALGFVLQLCEKKKEGSNNALNPTNEPATGGSI